MCTAVSYRCGGHCFGRTLDLEYSSAQELVVTPRNFGFRFRCAGELSEHYAMIGVAFIADGYPLYYDAANEYGLCIAGLNFPGNACYFPYVNDTGKINVAPFELIPFLLCQCRSVADARNMLDKIIIADISFSDDLPNTPLHWMISDKYESVVVEQLACGLCVYENKYDVMTNNPPFDVQQFSAQAYRSLSAYERTAEFGFDTGYSSSTKGTGSIGLPGGYTSSARFVRAAFTAANTLTKDDTAESRVGAFFHVMDNITVNNGCVRSDNGKYFHTRYTSCWEDSSASYYYTTYNNRRISSLSLFGHELDCDALCRYPMDGGEDIRVIEINKVK